MHAYMQLNSAALNSPLDKTDCASIKTVERQEEVRLWIHVNVSCRKVCEEILASEHIAQL